MATYLNEVRLLGFAGNDPETHTFEDGNMVCNISLATTRYWRKKGSEDWSEETTWHRLVLYGRIAEQAADQFRKGSRIFVSGYIRSRKVEDKYYTDIVVDRFINLDPKDGAGERYQGHSGDRAPPTPSEPSVSDPLKPLSDPDDDLPF
jgi:single-strand DNA-binding protein